jgi:SAM-dependent methyltransferase
MLTEREIAEKLSREDLDEWLRLWWVSQGGEPRNRRLRTIAEMLAFSRDREIAVLDLCCGPGDLSRFVRDRFPNARIDCVDRDPFLLALCAQLNTRQQIPGRTFVRDLWEVTWSGGLPTDYDAVLASTALHWFDVKRLGELFADVFGLLKHGGVFLFAEPACAEQRFASAFDEWKAKQSEGYDPSTWERFWERANGLLGYNHREILSKRPTGRGQIGDDGIPVMEYANLLKSARFGSIDVLLRDSEKVVMAACKL